MDFLDYLDPKKVIDIYQRYQVFIRKVPTMDRKITKIWTTAEGKEIRICDMTDEHLHNAIAFCERTAIRLEQGELSAGYNL